MIPGTTTLSSGNLLETHFGGPPPRGTKSETLGADPATHVSTSPLDLSDVLKVENHYKGQKKSYYLLPD